MSNLIINLMHQKSLKIKIYYFSQIEQISKAIINSLIHFFANESLDPFLQKTLPFGFFSIFLGYLHCTKNFIDT